MKRAGRLSPRFGLEAGFLIGVAVVLGLLEVSWPAIVGAMAIAWVVVAVVEIVLARPGTVGAAQLAQEGREERDPFRDLLQPPR